mgnify:CR=1 FL=1
MAALAQFLLLEKFATSTYFALTLICFVDLIGSIVVQSRRASAVRTASRTNSAVRDVAPATPVEPAVLPSPASANEPTLEAGARTDQPH